MQNGGISKQLTRIVGGYTEDGGSDVGDSVFADFQAMARYDGWRYAVKTVTSPAANANLFTIAGTVQIRLFAVVSVSVAGIGGNASIGDTGLATRYMGNVVNTTLDAGMVWINNAAAAYAVSADPTIHTVNAVASQTNTIILTVGDSWAGGGTLAVFAHWRPVAASGTDSVVAAA